MSYTTDAARWRALTTRDQNANGHFIYSVRSTNIYCRPICPGRLARRANVAFYATALEAEAAGFRACKRCKPNAVLEDPQKRAVEKACCLIDAAIKADDYKSTRLRSLAEKVNLTPRYFHKIFKDKTGLTPKEYAERKPPVQRHPSITADSTSLITISEVGLQPWDTASFDFNDLIDFGTDSSLSQMDDLGILQTKPSVEDQDPGCATDERMRPWDEACDSNGLDSNLFDNENVLFDPWPAASCLGARWGRKMGPIRYTTEQNVATLVDCNSLTNTI